MGATAARFFVTPRRTIKVNSYDLGPGETYASRPALVDEKERNNTLYDCIAFAIAMKRRSERYRRQANWWCERYKYKWCP